MSRLLLFHLLLSVLVTVGQVDEGVKKRQIDSLQRNLRADSARIFRKTRAKLYLRIENRNSFISGTEVNLFGLMAGVTFFEKHTLCTGYFYFYDQGSTLLRKGDDSKTTQLTGMNFYKFSYLYILLNSRYVQLNLPLEIGYGQYHLDLTDRVTHEIEHSAGSIIAYSGGVQGIFKPVKWIGLSLLGGYRYVPRKNTAPDFSGWFYTIGLWIDARQIGRNIKYKSVKKLYHQKLSSL